MTVPLSPMFDPTDNPYMPRSMQNIRLDIDPNDLAFPHPIPAFPLNAHAPAMLAAGPMNGRDSAYGIHNVENNSRVPLEEDEFPTYFKQIGSPPRLFHSHGSYALPVDSDETKVRCRTPRTQNSFLTSSKSALPGPQRQEAQHILLRMIIGSNYDAPLRELLNSNSYGLEVVDICTGAGHWCVISLRFDVRPGTVVTVWVKCVLKKPIATSFSFHMADAGSRASALEINMVILTIFQGPRNG
jgi:hypothetical protein